MSRPFRFTVCFILTLSILIPWPAQGQVGTTIWRDSRVPFRLLPGYKIKAHSGFEGGASGVIWKEGGPRVEFDMDIYTASAVDSTPKEKLVWREEQKIGKNEFICIFTRSGELVITVQGRYPANFRAKIRNQKELTEVMLTILTFSPFEGYPVDPSAIVNQP